MQTSTSVSAIFNCSLERAFKTPILGDATKTIGAGYGFIPRVTHFINDKTWGNVGGSRIPYAEKNLATKGGPIGIDRILVREENKYWKWELTDFRLWAMGFTKFEGELFFEARKNQDISVKWIYTLHSKGILAYPVQWLFARISWNGIMRKAFKKMKYLAETEDSFIYQ
jgi:hypothetical protein